MKPEFWNIFHLNLPDMVSGIEITYIMIFQTALNKITNVCGLSLELRWWKEDSDSLRDENYLLRLIAPASRFPSKSMPIDLNLNDHS